MVKRSKNGYTLDALNTLLAYAEQLGFEDDVEFYKEELKDFEPVTA